MYFWIGETERETEGQIERESVRKRTYFKFFACAAAVTAALIAVDVLANNVSGR